MNPFENTINKILKNLPLIMGIAILFMDAVAFAAPVLAEVGFDGPAHIIYRIYGFLCHQRPWRSIHLFDYKVAWCTRDTFIYLSMGLAALLVTKFKIRRVPWYLALLSIVPFALDGGIQFIAELKATLSNQDVFFYASTNFFRMFTGALFGGGAGLWLFSLLAQTLDEEMSATSSNTDSEKDPGKKDVHWLVYYLAIVAICLVTYLGLVQLWRVTSPQYGPSGIVDHVRYYPGVNYEDVGRSGHGV